MFLLTLISLLVIFISIFMMILASILSKKSLNDREKLSPFECGFDPKSSSRMMFSLQFFLIGVIFLIFDVEIALLLPFIMIMDYSNIMMYSFTSFMFLMILLMGLYHEWTQGALNWAN
uniref:NADH-ubiquinone oxidoreductase chain 3 n=1 Tax=Madachauliodes sp. TaxID=2900212 RepID=A0A8K1ZAB8_9NEOP|nr:NADH dehydrogenase subunit 3 [Madachauliodes sp.]